MIQKEYWCLIWNMNVQSASSIWSNLLSNATVNIIEIVRNCVRGGEANVYGSSYYWNFRTSSFKQVACLILVPNTHVIINMSDYKKLISLLSKDKNVMARTRKFYLKNNYLTLRSKVKVPRRSLWYVTHHLMIIHPHTIYNWPIWKDKKVMVWTSFAEKKQKKLEAQWAEPVSLTWQ